MIFINTRAGIQSGCARLAASNAPQLPLFAAAAAGRIAVVQFAYPANIWPKAAMERLPRPAVALVGDDADHDATGPDGWAVSSGLRRWARAAVIHGAGGEHQHYRWAVAAALQFDRVAFVETTSARVVAWRAFLNCPRTFMIIPKSGPHPVAPAMVARH